MTIDQHYSADTNFHSILHMRMCAIWVLIIKWISCGQLFSRRIIPWWAQFTSRIWYNPQRRIRNMNLSACDETDIIHDLQCAWCDHQRLRLPLICLYACRVCVDAETHPIWPHPFYIAVQNSSNPIPIRLPANKQCTHTHKRNIANQSWHHLHLKCILKYTCGKHPCTHKHKHTRTEHYQPFFVHIRK